MATTYINISPQTKVHLDEVGIGLATLGLVLCFVPATGYALVSIMAISVAQVGLTVYQVPTKTDGSGSPDFTDPMFLFNVGSGLLAGGGAGYVKYAKILEGSEADMLVNGLVNTYLGTKLSAISIVLSANDYNKDTAALVSSLKSSLPENSIRLSDAAGDSILYVQQDVPSPTAANVITSIAIDTNSYQLDIQLKAGDGLGCIGCQIRGLGNKRDRH